MRTSHPFVLAGVVALATTSAAGRTACAGTGPTDGGAHPKLTANIAVVSDYVVRGVSYSDHAPAIQGGVDVVDPSGWSVGVWTSPIDEYAGSTEEIDLYAARSFSVAGTELSIGATAFVFPNGKDTNIGDIDVSAARAIGPVDATLTVNYVWPQANLGDEDDLYVSVSGVTPVGRVAGAQISVSGNVGYDEGAFVQGDSKVDWSVGVSAEVRGVAFSVAYADNDLEDARGDPIVVLSISHTF